MTTKKPHQAVAQKLPVLVTNKNTDSATDKSRSGTNSVSFSLLYSTSMPLSELTKWWRLWCVVCLYLSTVNLIWFPIEKKKEVSLCGNIVVFSGWL